MRGRLVLLLGAAMLIAACTPSDEVKALARFRVENAQADADRAIAAGDHRLYLVYGYASEIPGAPGGEAHSCGVRAIEETSDHGDLEANARARGYAEVYNKRVLARTNCLAG